MKKKAIYPGTFDPVTKGHIDIIIRAAKLFPKLVVAVATNPTKRPFFSVEQRIGFIQEALEGIPGVIILGFDNLLIDFVNEQNANVILRSLRAVADVEYEFQLANMNRKLAKDVETILLPPSEQFMYVSSTLVREIASLGGDISPFVPEFVVEAFKKKRL